MLADLLRSRPRGEQRAMQVKPWGDWTSSAASAAGVNVDSNTALQLLAVYGSVALISDTIATLPIDVFRRGQDGTAVEVSPPPWLEQPNPTTDIVELNTQLLSSLLLDGNAYVSYSLDAGFVVNELTALDPSIVQIKTAADGRTPVVFVKGEQFRGRLKHIKGITRPGALKALSPVEAARQGIGLGLAAQEFGGRFFGNGINMSGVIEVPNDISVEDAKEMKAMWSRDHAGLARAWEPGILKGGATWKQLSVTPEQAQFLESRKFQASEIAAQMFLLDPTLLGIPIESTSLTYANLEQRGIHLVQFTLLRWIVRLERFFSSLLPRPQFMKFNVNGLMRADLKTRYEAYRIGIETGFVNANEARAKENMAPYDGGDTFFTPGMQTNVPVGDEPQPEDAG